MNQMQIEKRREQLTVILEEAERYLNNHFTGAMYNEGYDKDATEAYIQDFQESRKKDKYSRVTRNDVEDFVKQGDHGENISFDGVDLNGLDLAEFIYNETKAYSFISSYLKNKDVEEININAWDDIKIHYSDGSIVQLDETFLSPEHAKTVVDKMLRDSSTLLDQATPIVRGHISDIIRITASQPPILDKSCGVQANIRIVNPKQFEKKDFIRLGTSNEEIYDFLLQCFMCGISIAFIGATGTGKTTMMSSLLRLIPPKKRLITIENQVREFDLIKRDPLTGRKINSVIHWQSSDVCSQETLLEYALTSNPDYICLAEMKGKESFSVTEAARTGHSVTTSLHGNSCRESYDRMVTMCQKASNIDYTTLYRLCASAFPIAVFIEKNEDNSRKIMEITECQIDDHLQPVFRTLFEYQVINAKVDIAAGEKIKGQFKKVSDVSPQLKKLFIKKGFEVADELPQVKAVVANQQMEVPQPTTPSSVPSASTINPDIPRPKKRRPKPIEVDAASGNTITLEVPKPKKRRPKPAEEEVS